MTATMQTKAATNGWNSVVDALNAKKNISDFSNKIKEVQASHKPSSPLFHYAEGAKDAITEYEKTGEIPCKA